MPAAFLLPLPYTSHHATRSTSAIFLLPPFFPPCYCFHSSCLLCLLIFLSNSFGSPLHGRIGRGGGTSGPAPCSSRWLTCSSYCPAHSMPCPVAPVLPSSTAPATSLREAVTIPAYVALAVAHATHCCTKAVCVQHAHVLAWCSKRTAPNPSTCTW